MNEKARNYKLRDKKRDSFYSDEVKSKKSEKNEWRKYGKNILKVYNYN